MANAVSKITFSESEQGKGIKVAATSTPGTPVHTTDPSATFIDEVWLYAWNSHTADLALTVEFGGTSAPEQNIVVTIPAQSGLALVVPGLPLLGNGTTGLSVKAFCPTANKIVILGFVNRITP